MQIRTAPIESNPNSRIVLVNGRAKGTIQLPQTADQPYRLTLLEGTTATVYTYESLADLAEALRDKFSAPQPA